VASQHTSTSTRPVAPVPADAVRLAGLGSLLVAVVWFDAVAVALMFLVLGGLVVPRLLAVPGPLDVTYGVAVLVAAWSGVLDVYTAVRWWDLVVHAVVTGLVAVLAYGLVVRLGVALDPADVARRSHRVGVPVLTTALGLGLSVLWEIGEWLGHTYLEPSIFVSEVDTLGDLAAGGVGSFVAGLAVMAAARGRLG
jgi:hypothetical protein